VNRLTENVACGFRETQQTFRLEVAFEKINTSSVLGEEGNIMTGALSKLHRGSLRQGIHDVAGRTASSKRRAGHEGPDQHFPLQRKRAARRGIRPYGLSKLLTPTRRTRPI